MTPSLFSLNWETTIITSYVCTKLYSDLWFSPAFNTVPAVIIGDQKRLKHREDTDLNIPATCSAPPNIDNGQTKSRVKDKYASGETVQYVCNSGYAFQKGNKEAKCEDTQWKSVPVCRRKGDRCGSPPIVKYGDYLEQRKLNYDSGSLLEYKCPNYYKPQGSLTIKCEDGVWGDPPICLEPCTAKDTDVERNNIMFRWIGASKLYLEHDDIMEFICKAGFENPEPRLRVKCNRGVIPYPTCYHIGSCLLSQQSMKSRNIYLNRSSEIRHGEEVQFKCNEGMMPENTLEATCNNRVLNYPTCIVSKLCRISLDELNGRNIELNSAADVNTTLKDGEDIPVKCKAGFKNPNTAISLKGECNDGNMKYSRCFNGPTCRLIQESLDINNLELDPIYNNDVYYGEGEDVKFRCKYGFYSISKPTGKCGENGLIYPTCTEATTTSGVNAEVNKNSKTQLVIKNSLPTPLSNPQQVQRFYTGVQNSKQQPPPLSNKWKSPLPFCLPKIKSSHSGCGATVDYGICSSSATGELQLDA
ncbi:coagulation factor XIII B chain-like [Pelodytes ibericus]